MCFEIYLFFESISVILCNCGVNLEPLWMHLGATLGLLVVYAGDVGSLLGQFWAIYTSNGISENVHATRAKGKIKRATRMPRKVIAE